jgi:hypothetical protein
MASEKMTSSLKQSRFAISAASRFASRYSENSSKINYLWFALPSLLAQADLPPRAVSRIPLPPAHGARFIVNNTLMLMTGARLAQEAIEIEPWRLS